MSVAGKRTLVLLHGWAMTPAVWQPVIRLLANDETICAPPLPGHGGAARPAKATLAAWADALALRVPLGSTVVGWSLGALLALELARRHPERVSALALISATARFVAGAGWPHGLDPATVDTFLDSYAFAPVTALRRFLALQTLGEAARREWLPQLETSAQPHSETVPQPALRDGLDILAASDLRDGLAAIRQPARLIHGAGDALMPAAAADWLSSALPHAELTVLENCGHALPLSRPADCAALIQEVHEPRI
jgi:pimeloyl-[acyl-carrier protein] methyl ester esterase